MNEGYCAGIGLVIVLFTVYLLWILVVYVSIVLMKKCKHCCYFSYGVKTCIRTAKHIKKSQKACANYRIQMY